jgi:hypothetical protein
MSRTESHFIFVVPLTIRFFVWDYFGLMRHQFSFLSGADAAGMETREDAKPLAENIEPYDRRNYTRRGKWHDCGHDLRQFQVCFKSKIENLILLDRNQSGEQCFWLTPRLKFNNT